VSLGERAEELFGAGACPRPRAEGRISVAACGEKEGSKGEGAAKVATVGSRAGVADERLQDELRKDGGR
jgi:hypothetical protein